MAGSRTRSPTFRPLTYNSDQPIPETYARARLIGLAIWNFCRSSGAGASPGL